MDDKKRIAIFINSAYGGGAERVVSILSNELNNEYELYVFLIDCTQKFYEYSGTIINLGGNSNRFVFNLINACFNLNKYIRKYNIECVVSFLDFPNLINTIFNKSCRKIISIRSQMDESIYNTLREKVKLQLAKKYFKRADAVISVANEMDQSIGDIFNIEKTKRCVIVNPYDLEMINEKANKEISSEVEKFVKKYDTAIAVGRIDEQKDYDTLIDIFAMVHSKNSKAGLIILGKGALEEKIKDKIKAKGLNDCVLMLGIQKNPFSYMDKCMLYVSVSLYEGFPNALVEAMACGLPCIHTDCKTGPREILTMNVNGDIQNVIYGEYGILAPSYTRGYISISQMKEMYAQAWNLLLEDDVLREKYRKMSKIRVKDFSIRSCVNSYKNIIEQVIN